MSLSKPKVKIVRQAAPKERNSGLFKFFERISHDEHLEQVRQEAQQDNELYAEELQRERLREVQRVQYKRTLVRQRQRRHRERQKQVGCLWTCHGRALTMSTGLWHITRDDQ
jgi:hypothetical protein